MYLRLKPATARHIESPIATAVPTERKIKRTLRLIVPPLTCSTCSLKTQTAGSAQTIIAPSESPVPIKSRYPEPFDCTMPIILKPILEDIHGKIAPEKNKTPWQHFKCPHATYYFDIKTDKPKDGTEYDKIIDVSYECPSQHVFRLFVKDGLVMRLEHTEPSGEVHAYSQTIMNKLDKLHFADETYTLLSKECNLAICRGECLWLLPHIETQYTQHCPVRYYLIGTVLTGDLIEEQCSSFQGRGCPECILKEGEDQFDTIPHAGPDIAWTVYLELTPFGTASRTGIS